MIIEMTQHNPPSVLIYTRPWSSEQFNHLAREIWPNCNPIEISEHKSCDVSGLSPRFYEVLKKTSSTDINPDLCESQINDVILRCRLLRALSRDQARVYIYAMNEAVEYFFETHRPVAALSVTVDSYIIHLFYLACKRRGIPFIGLVPSFVNGHFRITALGEHTPSRAVNDEEVAHVCEMLLRPEYKPAFLAQTPQAVRHRTMKSWARNLPKPLWFRVHRLLEGDPLNYHYLFSHIISQRHWTLLPQGYIGQRPERREDLRGVDTSKPLVFLPLQMSPEATIDYWSADTSWIAYEDRVLDLLDSYRNSHVFLVKEHPNVVGYRTRGFYRRMAELPNCALIAPEVSSNSVFGLCDGTVICTGTVGFEAALRGVRVFSDSKPWHLPSDVLRPMKDLSTLAAGTRHQAPAPENIIRNLLEGLRPGRFINDGSWRADNPEHIRANEGVASALQNNYQCIFGK